MLLRQPTFTPPFPVHEIISKVKILVSESHYITTQDNLWFVHEDIIRSYSDVAFNKTLLIDNPFFKLNNLFILIKLFSSFIWVVQSYNGKKRQF